MILKKYFIALLYCFTLSSCFTDVIENFDVKKINAKSIEEILKDSDLSRSSFLKDTADIPILAWMGVPENYTSIERYQEMKDAGFYINQTNYSNAENLQIALDIAQQLNMKLMIRCPELYTHTENIVRRFKDHPANGGYFLQDEPFANSFSYLKSLVKLINSIDSNNICYINLNPDYAFHSLQEYNEYIQAFLENVPVKILSFDYYPIVDNFIRGSWYQNLEIIKSASSNKQIPFWAFALTTAHGAYPIPDINQLRLQVYSNLAYGAKGIQYFTYWTPVSKTWDFHSGPIEPDGTKTVVYKTIKELNDEFQKLSYIFLSSEVTRVTHFGKVPQGTSEFSNPPYFVNSLNISGGNALISEMKNDKNTFLMIQNTNIDNEIAVKIKTDKQTQIILKNGVIIPANYINEDFKLTPGDMAIFMR